MWHMEKERAQCYSGHQIKCYYYGRLFGGVVSRVRNTHTTVTAIVGFSCV